MCISHPRNWNSLKSFNNKDEDGLNHIENNYVYQINQFLTVNSERYPFPFADWPDSYTSRVPPSEQA